MWGTGGGRAGCPRRGLCFLLPAGDARDGGGGVGLLRRDYRTTRGRRAALGRYTRGGRVPSGVVTEARGAPHTG